MDQLLTIAGWSLCGLWCLGFLLPLSAHWWRRFPRLVRRTAAPDTFPTLTVVVTAKDEGDRISDCLASLLASDYPHFTLVAVNDRSTDSTGDEIDRLAKLDPRVRPIHIETLPADWLGKNHAMWRGAAASDSDWILFTDGDVIYQKDTIRLAIGWSVKERLDHLAMIPSMLTGSLFETALVSFFGLIFAGATQSWLIRLPTRH
ncbi:MAG: glycosyltransferase family A protein, partial [Planctomycetota bacterium]|nr:glycosyltransferase family A protein [Planctomycetota bacterium]